MDLNMTEIRELIQLIDQSSIDELEYEQEGEKIVLNKNNGTVGQLASSPAYQQQFSEVSQVKDDPRSEQGTENENKTLEKTQQDENIHTIKSPMVGTFYASPSPETGAYVKVGDRVHTDTVVCIVEAMKLFNEIEAEDKGEIVEILAEDGELVEYGQPLFSLRKQS